MSLLPWTSWTRPRSCSWPVKEKHSHPCFEGQGHSGRRRGGRRGVLPRGYQICLPWAHGSSRKFWGNKRNSRPNLTKNNSSVSKNKQRVRTCYNYGNVSHFVAECPYEKRGDNGGKLIHKDKAKSFPRKNNFTKKTPPKGLVAHEEYASDDDDEDTSGEGMEMASIAIATSPPSKVSLFGTPTRTPLPSVSWPKVSTR